MRISPHVDEFFVCGGGGELHVLLCYFDPPLACISVRNISRSRMAGI